MFTTLSTHSLLDKKNENETSRLKLTLNMEKKYIT